LRPATVYDIGAYRGGWTELAARVFPAAAFILFEPNADNAAYLPSKF
jgi:FkbM family methyltransferase